MSNLETHTLDYGTTESFSSAQKQKEMKQRIHTTKTGSPEDSPSPSSRETTPASSPRNYALSLMERYNHAVSTKMYDVEELIDYYFHRRLAAVVAVVISYMPIVITPNQITIFGLGLGWLAASFLYDSTFHEPYNLPPNLSLFYASALMFCWIVSDCADGQVARLCKRGTRTGRILDGFVDGLVIAPHCIILAMICGEKYATTDTELYMYYTVGTIAGLSLWVHALVYDKVKNVYMENSLPYSEVDGETLDSVRAEYKEAKAKTTWALDTILLGIYVIYLTLQNLVTTEAAVKAEEARQSLLAKASEEYRQRYISKYQYLARIASFMGISAHVSGFYVAYLTAIFYSDALFYVQLYFAIVLNIILVIVEVLYARTGMSTAAPSKSGSNIAH